MGLAVDLQRPPVHRHHVGIFIAVSTTIELASVVTVTGGGTEYTTVWRGRSLPISTSAP